MILEQLCTAPPKLLAFCLTFGVQCSAWSAASIYVYDQLGFEANPEKLEEKSSNIILFNELYSA